MPSPGLSRPKNIPGSLQFAGGMKFTRYAWNGTQTAPEDVIARLKSARSNSKTETSILARLAAQKAYGQSQSSAPSTGGGDAADALAWANNRKAELKTRLDNALASGAEVKNISEKEYHSGDANNGVRYTLAFPEGKHQTSVSYGEEA